MINIYKGELPSNSLLKDVPRHFIDSYHGTFIVDQELTMEDAVKLFFTASPPWVKNLFGFRNKIVKMLGLKATNIDASKINDFRVTVGQSLGLFKVMEKNGNEVILGEDDKHLDFRVSIYLVNNRNEQHVTISTIAVFHNNFGKIYFRLIKPFHKVIVRRMLSNMLKA